MKFTEEKINKSLKRSILSLISRRRRPKVRGRSLAASRIPGLALQPQALEAPAQAGLARRCSPRSGYVRGHYLPCPNRIRAGQPLFRVG